MSASFVPKTTDSDVYRNYKLVITYDVTQEDHCGYCSDPYDDYVTNSSITYTYPLLRIFKKSDIKDDNTIDLYCPHLTRYIKKSEPHGNGYCGKKTTYRMVRAHIIKNISDGLDG